MKELSILNTDPDIELPLPEPMDSADYSERVVSAVRQKKKSSKPVSSSSSSSSSSGSDSSSEESDSTVEHADRK